MSGRRGRAEVEAKENDGAEESGGDTQDFQPASTAVTPAKRARKVHGPIGRGLDGETEIDKEKLTAFKEGAIVRVKLNNFVTYNEVEFCPGPNLNVIIGPNGTGKSSVVAGICLGLAGKPSVLDRATKVQEFIRIGENEARIEIELFQEGENKNLVIQRIINKSSSKFKINGKNASEQEVKTRVHALGIQIDNLVQFLPQDRVADFAKMNPQELLIATEKTANEELHEKHMELIELGKTMAEHEQRLETLHANIDEEKSQNELRKREFERWKLVQDHKRDLQIMQKKLPWLEYEQARLNFLESKEKVAKETARLREEFKFLEPMRKKHKEMDSSVRAYRELHKELKGVVGKLQRNLNKSAKAFTDASETVSEVQGDIKQNKRQQEKYKARLDKAEAAQREIMAAMENTARPETFKEEQTALKKKQRELRLEQNSITDDIDDKKSAENQKLRHKAKLNNLINETESVQRRKMDEFLKVNRHLSGPISWVNEQNRRLREGNQSAFREEVFLPLILNINVRNINAAKYVEASIPGRQMNAFVAKNGEDQKALVTRFRSGPNAVPINVLRLKRGTYDNVASDDKLAQLGLDGLLIDQVEAPEDIKMFLGVSCNLHQIPFAFQAKSGKQAEDLQSRGFLTYYLGDEGFRVMRSRFGAGSNALRVEQLRKPRFLSLTVDNDRLKDLKRQVAEVDDDLSGIQTGMAELQRRAEDVRNQMNALTKALDDIKQKMSAHRRLESQLQSAKAEYNSFTDSLRKAQKSVAGYETDLKKALAASFSATNDLKEHARALTTQVTKLQVLTLQQDFVVLQAREVALELQKSEAEEQEALQRFDELKKLNKQNKHNAVKKLNEAKASNDGEMPDEAQKQAFSTFPDEIDALTAEIEMKKHSMDGITRVDEAVIRTYHEKIKEIEKLEKELSDSVQDVSERKKKLQTLHLTWERKINTIVSSINETYSEFFAQLGCAGTVGVLKHESDFAEWGVEISVSFRKGEELQRLQSHHQSGGERSVSTMLYLMAMQQLATCPFRVVDEINQGMDATNEKRVFEQVVNCSTAFGSQYFLITPKLLPNLKYNEYMRVFCVYNGPHMVPSKAWRISTFLKKAAELAAVNKRT